MNYERGWDQHPASRRDRNVLQEILAGFPGRQREQTSNEPGTAEGRPRARFTFSKGRRSQRIRDDDEYER
jgi:hypothetical protein